jgi:hypothetical protein
VSIRHAALSIGAVLVLGLGVYLFVEVRAHPVPVAGASSGAAPPRTAADPPAVPAQPVNRPAAPPARAPASGSVPPAPTPGSIAGSGAAPTAAPGPAPAAAPPLPDPDALSGPRLDAAMAEANRAYDRGDLDDAKALASRLLAQQPTNARMLRIMVSASCIDGDSATALASFVKLPAPDQAQMRTRCARYGVSFPDKP